MLEYSREIIHFLDSEYSDMIERCDAINILGFIGNRDFLAFIELVSTVADSIISEKYRSSSIRPDTDDRESGIGWKWGK